MKQLNWRMSVILASLSVISLSGCTTSGPASADSLSKVLGQSLPGTQGKSLEDQRSIDTTIARGCGAKVYTPTNCDKHTEASAARKAELR